MARACQQLKCACQQLKGDLSKSLLSWLVCLTLSLWPFPAFPNSALIFDGTDDYCEIPADPTLNLSSEITIEAWVLWGGNSGSIAYQIVLNQDAVAYEIAIGGALETGHFLWYLDGITSSAPTVSGAWKDAGPIVANEWTHIALIYDGTRVRTYINGIETGNYSAIGNISIRNNHVRIGARSVGAATSFFNGAIDEVRLWSVGRTATEVLETRDIRYLGAAPGLVANFSFEEGRGQFAGDSGPFWNHARLGITSGVDNQDPTWGSSDAIPLSFACQDWNLYR